jgi:hypothetical protein
LSSAEATAAAGVLSLARSMRSALMWAADTDVSASCAEEAAHPARVRAPPRRSPSDAMALSPPTPSRRHQRMRNTLTYLNDWPQRLASTIGLNDWPSGPRSG